MRRSPGIVWIKAAVIYFILGVGLGIYMGASGDHLLVPVHAHFNLLGWASLAVVGLIYQQFPVAGSHRLATVQFWLHNAGLIAAMVLLIGALRGNNSLEPLLGVASIVIGVSVVLFAINVFQNIREG
jgi:cbb3-type cytochrome oxidase subunit 1